MTVLHLTARGTAFSNNPHSDVNNYRVTATIIDTKERILHVEFTRASHWRFYNKRTGKPLKKPVITNEWALHITAYYDGFHIIDGKEIYCTSMDVGITRMVYESDYSFTKADILKAVNRISKIKYNGIAIDNRKG